jgi:hypothetical protein
MLSCAEETSKEEFNILDPNSFNRIISKRSDLHTPEQIMEFYYDYPVYESDPPFSIDTKEIENGAIEVTLVHDNMADDSIQAIKIIMVLKQQGGTWEVLEIKSNYKCREGRGHTDWGKEWCS